MERSLSHHGIKGQKWGVRRFQNADGSLTPAGRSRYSEAIDKAVSTAKDTAKRVSESASEIGKGATASFMSSSLGKKAAKVLLLGPFGTITYESMKAAGASKTDAIGATIVSSLLGGPIGNLAVSAITVGVHTANRNKSSDDIGD